MLAAILGCFVVLVHGGDVGSYAPGNENDSSVSLLQTRAEMMQDGSWWDHDYYEEWAKEKCPQGWPADMHYADAFIEKDAIQGETNKTKGVIGGCNGSWALDPADWDCCIECPSKKAVSPFRRRYARSTNRCPTGMIPQSYSMPSTCCKECATATCSDIKEKPECKSNGGCSNLNCKWSKGVCHGKSELPQKKCKASCDKSMKPWKKKCKNSKCAACPECAPPTPAPTPAPAPTYTVIVSGTCEQHGGLQTIVSKSQCESAAQSLGFSDTTASFNPWGTPRPYGCVTPRDRSSLTVYTNDANKGNGAGAWSAVSHSQNADLICVQAANTCDGWDGRANNGRCDEPTSCPTGTDCADCSKIYCADGKCGDYGFGGHAAYCYADQAATEEEGDDEEEEDSEGEGEEEDDEEDEGEEKEEANSTCTTKAELQPEHEAGTCVGRCHTGYSCCHSTNRCGPVGNPCGNPPATCIGTCTGSLCCPAQGNQCIKGPVSNFDDLCKCAEV